MTGHNLNLAVLTETIVAAAAVPPNKLVTTAGVYPVAGAAAMGVTMVSAITTDSGAAGDLLAVITLGIASVTAGATIAIGDELEAGANGTVIPAVTGVVVGVARTTGVLDGTCQMFIKP